MIYLFTGATQWKQSEDHYHTPTRENRF